MNGMKRFKSKIRPLHVLSSSSNANSTAAIVSFKRAATLEITSESIPVTDHSNVPIVIRCSLRVEI